MLAQLHRDRKFLRCAELGHALVELREPFALGFDALLPASMDEHALLRGETEMPFLPATVLQESKLFAELADVYCTAIRYRKIMRGPRIRAHFVLAPARVSPCGRFRFEQHEIAEAFLLQAPRRRQSGYAAADDYHGHLDLALGRGECRAIAD